MLLPHPAQLLALDRLLMGRQTISQLLFRILRQVVFLAQVQPFLALPLGQEHLTQAEI